MGEIRVFHENNGKPTGLNDKPFGDEKELQSFFEDNLLELTGIEVIKSEHDFGTWRRKFSDTLGLDENGCPVVIEYKLDAAAGALKQGLEYLCRVLHHEDAVRNLAHDKFGHSNTREINVNGAWLLCVAGSFTFRDIVAAEYCRRRVELLQYRRFAEGLVVLNQVELTPRSSHDREREGDETLPDFPQEQRQRLIQESVSSPAVSPDSGSAPSAEALSQPSATQPDFSKYKNWDKAGMELQGLFMEFHDYVVSLGEGGDVWAEAVENFIRFRWDWKQPTSSRRQNMIGVTLQPTKRDRWLVARVAYKDDHLDNLDLEAGFTRDLRGISRPTYGELEITIKNFAHLEKAKPLLQNSYKHH